MTRPDHTPSESDLRAVFNRCRCAWWPEMFADAMADPTIAKHIDTLARRGPAYLRQGVTRNAPSLRVPVPPPIEPGTPQRRALDRKQLAAGEKPEPDDDTSEGATYGEY